MERRREAMTPEEVWQRDEQRARALAAARAAPPVRSAGGTQSSKIPFPFQVGQLINGAEVVGVWDRIGAMLHLPRPKRWTKN